jgi:hypothetical protein
MSVPLVSRTKFGTRSVSSYVAARMLHLAYSRFVGGLVTRWSWAQKDTGITPCLLDDGDGEPEQLCS